MLVKVFAYRAMTMFTSNTVEHDYNMVSSKQQIKVNVFHLYKIR